MQQFKLKVKKEDFLLNPFEVMGILNNVIDHISKGKTPIAKLQL